MAAMLLLSSCCPHRANCSNRYCPPTAPTRPVCPPETPACKQPKPPCGCKKKQARPACRNRQAVSLGEVMDYLPGVAPGYWAI